MGMLFNWDNESQTILRMDYTFPIQSWEEYDAAIDSINTMAGSVNHKVDVIHCFGKTPVPHGAELYHLIRAGALAPNNVDLIVAVTQDRFTKVMISIAMTASYGTRYRLVDSLEQGYALIAADSQATALHQSILNRAVAGESERVKRLSYPPILIQRLKRSTT